MAAPTSTFCDYATGNDYKGATFTDGAFTVADMTLTKVGAFAASKANHWLYLDDNGSGEVTTGYYKIASVTSANAVVLATSPKSGANDPTDVVCTQAAGTTLLPWRSVQGALDLITRDATNGDQVNVKAGTAQVNQAALALTTYGTPAEGAPLVIRGYTSAANDGGIGEIDCNGAAMWAATNFFILVDLEIHSFGNNNGITGTTTSATRSTIYHCEVHKGVSTPTSKYLTNVGMVIGCYIHDAGTTGGGIFNNWIAYGNYVYNCPTGIASGSTIAINNIVVDCTAFGIDLASDNGVAIGNSIYSSTASTGTGIRVGATFSNAVILNNIIEGYSGAGAEAILGSADIFLLGFNAFFNNTTAESLGDVYIDLGNDATPASSPFTNAGAGDFSLLTSVSGSCLHPSRYLQRRYEYKMPEP